MKTTTGNLITIPRKLTNGKELVILTRDEYERQIRRSKEITEALHIIVEGEQAYRQGKTIAASSLEEALKLYERR